MLPKHCDFPQGKRCFYEMAVPKDQFKRIVKELRFGAPKTMANLLKHCRKPPVNLHRFLNTIFSRILAPTWLHLGSKLGPKKLIAPTLFRKTPPKGAQERPRVPQERPKSVQECPKSAPWASKTWPGDAQERPKSAQERPRTAQECPKHTKTRKGMQKHKQSAKTRIKADLGSHSELF